MEWHPGRSTRVLRVIYGAQGEPERIQRCVSSDNNNAVLLSGPFVKRQVLDAAAQEVASLLARNVRTEGCDEGANEK